MEPTLWAQRFYHPWLTDLFSFCYEFYLPLVVLLPAILYFQSRDREARQALLGIVLCFYWGYFLYIAFRRFLPGSGLRISSRTTLKRFPGGCSAGHGFRHGVVLARRISIPSCSHYAAESDLFIQVCPKAVLVSSSDGNRFADGDNLLEAPLHC